jgi:PAS domain S-box-containing protein
MAVQKYDIRRPSGDFEERFWTPSNSPVLGDDGAIRYIIHCVEDITEFVRSAEPRGDVTSMQAEIVRQAVQLQHANRELRRLNAEFAANSETQFHALFDFMPQLGWTARPDGFIDFYNRRWFEYTGTTMEQMQGWGWQAVQDPAYLPKVVEHWQESLRTGAPFEMEFPLRRHDGVFRWFLTRTNPIRDASGAIVRWVGINTDIHDRTREAAQSEGRFRLLVDSIEDYAVFMLDAQGLVTSWNAGARRIMQYSDEEIIGKHFSIFLTDEDKRGGKSELELRTARGGRRYREESWRVRKDGTRFWANVTISAIRDQDDHVIGFSKVTRDLTAQREAEAERIALAREQQARGAAEAAESHFRFLAEAGAILGSSLDYGTTLQSLAKLVVPQFADWCAVDVLEGDRIVQVAVAHVDPAKVEMAREWNARWEPKLTDPGGTANVLRTGRSALYEEISDELLALGARDAEHLALARALKLRSAMSVPLTARGRTLGALSLVAAESHRRYTAADLPLMEELGRRAGIAVDNARLYDEAQRSISLRDEFLSIASHELRTPLTSLQLQVSGMQRTVKRPDMTMEKVGDKLVALDRHVGRLTDLVNALLDVSRASAGRLQLDPSDVDLVAVVRDVAARFQPDLANARSFLSMQLPEALVGRWDPMRLDQIVTNFLSNAVKYGAGKAIEMGVRSEGGRAILTVRDHGIGIAASDQRRIFERYGRAVSAEHYGGLGLGLWIVRVYVDAMGGSIHVASEPGRGSLFTVELPLQGAPASAGATAEIEGA